MSSLGHFGGSTKTLRGTSGFTGTPGTDGLDQAREQLTPSPEGMPALSQQLAQLLAGYGINLISNGSFESWSAGTTSAPDKWTLTGAGASVAKETTDVQDDIAAVDLTAALNTATDLGQSITISASQNARLRGREVTFSARVLASAADRVFLRIDDGVGTTDSRFHVGNSAFETLAVTRTLDSVATKVEASLEISSGASITATFDAAKLEEGATATAFSLNFLDDALAISNFQNTTPTNFGDQGIWRMEVGRASLAGDTGQTNVTKTITYATAFRTIRGILLGGREVVGNTRIIWRADTEGVSTFILRAETANTASVNFADTSSGTCSWAALGQV